MARNRSNKNYLKCIHFNIEITLLILSISILPIGCKNDRSLQAKKTGNTNYENIKTPKGMAWVPSKSFLMGAKDDDNYAMNREKPAHRVVIDGFFIDETEVTNKQFERFINTTSYVTVAERAVDWEEMKKTLPPGTPRPHDSILQPGSLVFNKNVNLVANMGNYAQWWTWKIGANWKHPQGPESSIKGKENYPVVHIAYEDAIAYCKWANRRLPTEAEWESAAQGSLGNSVFTWGNDFEKLNGNANTWQGQFPIKNEAKDGFAFIAPIKSFPPNSIGIYDMLGNVWEITSDLFNINYYNEIGTSEIISNPKGANTSFNPNNPYEKEHIIKGGSFLCHASYCASFRISARMGSSFDSASDHKGFRTVVTPKMLENN
ncbi:Formylglycine-generating enzyme, required for sulfatase activity, contains SUMF1/FGE domain [Tenacibaculum sp. MAR_2009_124]|uniref:formylglycine-generating enzyme family protein n=1 Tax=Tenacibaculum sp. MAR_2009_124 TaxID=1250059 RepID=UPI000899C7E0|nr:formylglycine-generating enzyme family protein [Tenacibaculum sp. MAR_2009_124]SED14068.1 Formylglycine-generating enzyme, required for sulfatase activity, contains SUMF1/FGE domain [Tenacibaculum sp. MAR_2009_124]